MFLSSSHASLLSCCSCHLASPVYLEAGHWTASFVMGRVASACAVISCSACRLLLPCHIMLLLSSCASLVISCFSCHLLLLLSFRLLLPSHASLDSLRAGLRPALVLMGKVSFCLRCHFMLHLSCRDSIIISISSCHLSLLLFSYASLVISWSPRDLTRRNRRFHDWASSGFTLLLVGLGH